MALIRCPECGQENVSDHALHCPKCGYTVSAYYLKKKLKKLTLVTIIAIIAIWALVYLFTSILTQFEEQGQKLEYRVITFEDETQMVEAITGTWKRSDQYINYVDNVLYSWSNGDSDVDEDQVELDFEKGQIVYNYEFNNKNYSRIYDIVSYKGNTYLRINPSAKKAEDYFLFEKCNIAVPISAN